MPGSDLNSHSVKVVAVGNKGDSYSNHLAIVKAKELADTIVGSDLFKKGDKDELQFLIIECNQIINSIIKINYGAVCQPRSGCCS